MASGKACGMPPRWPVFGLCAAAPGPLAKNADQPAKAPRGGDSATTVPADVWHRVPSDRVQGLLEAAPCFRPPALH